MLVGDNFSNARDVAQRYGISNVSTDLSVALARDDVDAVILSTPSPMHAAQAIACMDAGKHVEVEIPLALSVAEARSALRKHDETGLVCMAGHTRRFNPPHQWLHGRILAGEIVVQQMDVQTFFHRRSNSNADGEARSWVDSLLWHHAAHTIDLFAYQTGRIGMRTLCRALFIPI
jgi:2-hydroxy-4-carboxymuconate semialdehyde hemiacetal dehydrogenase